MRREDFNRKKKKFNEVTMTRGWSIPCQIKFIMNGRKNWYNGLTLEKLRKKVKGGVNLHKLKKGAGKKNINKGSIYKSISKINIYSEPAFIICSGLGYTPDGKKEYRYFVPYEEKDIDEVKDKLDGIFFRTKLKEKNLREYEKEKEHEEKIKTVITIKHNEKNNKHKQ